MAVLSAPSLTLNCADQSRIAELFGVFHFVATQRQRFDEDSGSSITSNATPAMSTAVIDRLSRLPFSTTAISASLSAECVRRARGCRTGWRDRQGSAPLCVPKTPARRAW